MSCDLGQYHLNIKQMKKYLFNIILLSIVALNFIGCDKFLEPELDDLRTEEEVWADPSFAEGVLMQVYKNLPGYYSFDEAIASDNAASNDVTSNITRMATGEWTSDRYPLGVWDFAYNNLNIVNYFLANYHNVEWSYRSSIEDSLHMKRVEGEAYALRAYFHMILLQYYGGKDESGNVLGVPLATKYLTVEDDLAIPRSSYDSCVVQIYKDCDMAIAALPFNYQDITGDFDWNTTMGERFTNRITSKVAMAIKSRTSLYAASPAYAGSSTTLWEQAAALSAQLVDSLGSSSKTGELEFYLDQNSEENIWSFSDYNSTNPEKNNFVPSLNGKGKTNPSQNLVEAFPMSNGYPIEHTSSGYDAQNPYVSRDARFEKYIVYNGISLKGQVISTADTSEVDGLNKQDNSTRTGYYLQKFIDYANASITPGNVKASKHYYSIFRHTELLLNFAEAANEAYGPRGTVPGYNFSAYDILLSIRARAGINSDDYLLEVEALGKEAFRELILNERRLELCFEGHRFWDIRRWMKIDVTQEPIRGMQITAINDSTVSYNPNFVVEQRKYEPHMIYGPIPYEETVRYDIVQNANWK